MSHLGLVDSVGGVQKDRAYGAAAGVDARQIVSSIRVRLQQVALRVSNSVGSAEGLARCMGAQGRNNCIEIGQKLLAVMLVKGAQHDLVNLDRRRFCATQGAPALIGQPYGVCASILSRSTALNKVLLEHTAHDVSESGTVDASLFDEMRLAQTLVLGHGHEHGELARRQVRGPELALENIACALPCPMQKMNR